MEITTSVRNGNTLVIQVGEKFDFGKVEAFRNAYLDLSTDITQIVVDLARTDYMDSSALGMLLNMQKALAERDIKYSIEKARPQVDRILKISRFDKKFDIK
jgi:anti-anti-sigma factor